jgi:hypothetical protein
MVLAIVDLHLTRRLRRDLRGRPDRDADESP